MGDLCVSLAMMLSDSCSVCTTVILSETDDLAEEESRYVSSPNC